MDKNMPNNALYYDTVDPDNTSYIVYVATVIKPSSISVDSLDLGYIADSKGEQLTPYDFVDNFTNRFPEAGWTTTDLDIKKLNISEKQAQVLSDKNYEKFSSQK